MIKPNVLIGIRARPIGRSGRFALVETLQPTKNIGDTVANFSSDSDAGRAAADGAQVIYALLLHAEIPGKLARRQYALETDSEELLYIHNPWVLEASQ